MISKNAIGIIWGVIDKLSSQVVSFIIGIVLARLLTPDDYGTIGLMMILITILNVLVEGGFSNALIRKLDRTDEDCSTAFYINLVLGIVLYTVLFLAAPLLAVFFESSILENIIRFLGLSVIFNSLCVVQRALLTAEMKIKVQTKIALVSQISMGIVAIVMAYRGAGVYSLAIQYVGSSVINTILFWIVLKWRPSATFNKDSFKYLINFGSKLVGANLLGTVFNQLNSFIIGKWVSKADLGYYSKANSLSSQPDAIVTGVIQKVIIPIFSQFQNNLNSMLEIYSRYVRLVMMILVPISALLIISAYEIIYILWGEQWLPCVWMFQLLVFSSIFSPLSTINLCTLQVIGRTDYVLKLEFIKKPIFLIIIILSTIWGLKGIVISQVVTAILASLINAYPTKKFLNYKYVDQFKDLFRYFCVGVVSSIPSYLIARFINSDILSLVSASVVFLLSYITILISLKDSLFKELTTRILTHKGIEMIKFF